MEQKDYLMREIEKISTILRYIVGKMLPSKNAKAETIHNELAGNLFKETGMDLDTLLKSGKEFIRNELTHSKGFDAENLEMLADLFSAIAKKGTYLRNEYLTKALQIYQLVDDRTRTFSFERIAKINQIKNSIETISNT